VSALRERDATGMGVRLPMQGPACEHGEMMGPLCFLRAPSVRPLFAFVVAAISAGAAGCNAIFGLDELQFPDAATDASTKGWRAVPSGVTTTLAAVWGASATDVWAVGADGTLNALTLHWDGTQWSKVPSPAAASPSQLKGVWGASSTDVWSVGDSGTVLHWDGNAWSQVDVGVTHQLDAVWGASGKDAWMVGNNASMLHWNGVSWTSVSSGVSSTIDIRAIGGIASGDIWAALGTGTSTPDPLIHWNGHAWTSSSTSSSTPLFGLTMLATNDVWAAGGLAGGNGIMLHWDGGSWSSSASASTTAVWCVWGSSTSDVWAVGDAGIIQHWDGHAWSLSPSGTSAQLNGAWGPGNGEVWAVGQNGTILIYR
jgi:hypothetical protein